MAEPIANLIVKVGSDVAGVVSGGKKATGSLKGMSEQAKKTAKAMAAMGAVGAAALTALTVKQMAVIDSTAKMARNLGIATDSFQALALVADEAGVAQEKLGPLFTKSQRSLVEASRGLETYARSFRTLNLDVDELLKMSPDKQFEEIAISLSKIENPTVRTSAAMEIFGRQGLGVIGMLEQFGEKVEEARKFNDRFNISINDIDGRMVEEANDTFARLGKVMGGLGNTIAIQIAPLITEVSNRLMNAGVDGEDFGTAVNKGMQVASGGIDLVRHALNGLDMSFNAVMMSISDLTAATAKHLYDFSDASAKFYNKFGLNREANSDLLEFGYDAKKMGEDAREGFNEAVSAAENFVTTYEKIQEIQDAAQKRAEEGSANGVNALLDPFSTAVGDDGDPKAQKHREQMEAKLEAFRESLRTEEESEIESHERRIEELVSYMEMRLVTEQEYNSLLEDEKARHEDALTEIEKKGLSDREKFERMSIQQKAKNVFGQLDEITAGVSQHNKALFRINQVAGIANAIISTHEGVTKTLGAYPQPLAGILAAGHLAAGMAQVAAIKSASFSGGGTGSAPSLAGSTPAQPVTPVGGNSGGSSRSLDVSMSGIGMSDLFTGEQVRALIGKINEEIDDGATIRGIRFS